MTAWDCSVSKYTPVEWLPKAALMLAASVWASAAYVVAASSWPRTVEIFAVNTVI